MSALLAAPIPVAYAVLVRQLADEAPQAACGTPVRGPACEALTYARGQHLIDTERVHGSVRDVAGDVALRWLVDGHRVVWRAITRDDVALYIDPIPHRCLAAPARRDAA